MVSTQRISFLLCIFLAIVPIINVDVPKALAVYPGVIGVVFYALYKYALKIDVHLSKNAAILCGTIFGLSAISLIWATHFDPSFHQVKNFALLLPPLLLLVSLAESLRKDHIAPYLHYYAFAVTIGAAVMILEILWGGLIFNLTHGRPMDVVPNTFEYNRGAILLVICSFGAMAILREKLNHIAAPLIIAIPLAIALFMCESQSAQLMFLVGFATIFLFPYKYKAAWILMKISIVSLMFVIPFIVILAFQHITSGVQDIRILYDANVGPRLEIWDYVSRYAMENPLTGYGVNVTRAITDFDCHYLFNTTNLVLHPHNFMLQIWIEFGLLGILLAIGFVYHLLTLIQTRFTIAQQKILLPTFMTSFLAASTAFGMWQGMWVACLFYAAAMAMLASKYIDKPKDI